MQQRLTAILPCTDLDAAQAFFERLGFSLDAGSPDEYRMMSDGVGGFIHLTIAVEGWLQAGRNPFGLYLYREDVDGLAAAFAGEVIGHRAAQAVGIECPRLKALSCHRHGRARWHRGCSDQDQGRGRVWRCQGRRNRRERKSGQ